MFIVLQHVRLTGLAGNVDVHYSSAREVDWLSRKRRCSSFFSTWGGLAQQETWMFIILQHVRLTGLAGNVDVHHSSAREVDWPDRKRGCSSFFSTWGWLAQQETWMFIILQHVRLTGSAGNVDVHHSSAREVDWLSRKPRCSSFFSTCGWLAQQEI